MQKLFISLFISLFASGIFSILCISFSFDISLFAFPLCTAFTVFCFYKSYSLQKTEDIKFVPIVRKLLQYLPYVLLAAFVIRRAGKNGTPAWYDVLTVFLWCIVFIFSIVALYFLNEKRLYSLNSDWKSDSKKNQQKKLRGLRRFSFEALDWIDAIVQAVFMVLLIQIFIVQLYMIPSESMVPKFLIGDRVVVFKTASGPKFPLSNVGLPCLKNYKRGDVVVFRNPHYSIDRKSEIKTVTSQLVYMLTLMMVNINKDENGNPKADPLVKHITGLPGEQLVMQDGILYARTKDSKNFVPVEEDKSFAAWNLNELDSNTKRRIANIPLSQSQYDVLLQVEDERRNLDLEAMATEAQNLSAKFKQLVEQRRGVQSAETENIFDKNELQAYMLFRNYESLTQRLITSRTGVSWFSSFLTSWIPHIPKACYAGGDIYNDANYRLNVMIKLCIGRLVVRNAELLFSNAPLASKSSDVQILEYLENAQKLDFYVRVLDQRNMPIFPANEADGSACYIPDDCYFMMGDNRFNSADMRHSYNSTLTNLTTLDPYSVTYYSYISPQYVNKKYILGKPVFRLWPLTRIGKI